MNRQAVDAIAQAVKYRLENLAESEEIPICDRDIFKKGIMKAKIAAMVTIYRFQDPAMCPDDWESYG